MEDIRGLLEIAHEGIEGVIVGRALYSKQVDLREANRVVRGSG
jgi:phosphoribosylformimino-5-aminoimidazole carboxamide ribotide isomerase